MDLIFKSELTRVSRATADIMSFIDERLPSLSSEERGDLRLIFHELLCNAVVHGNEGDADKSVSASVEIRGGYVAAEVSDEGCGFDYIQLLSSQECEDDIFNERGRGIRLVRWMTDTLYFIPPGNRIKFSKRVSAHG
jgi:serine/threonine-protein kinase RsbW